MKDVFCIGCYPSNNILRKLLKENIKSIRENTDFDIFLSTHYDNIDKEIIEMVDYFIYDKNNEFVDKLHSPCTITRYANYNVIIYNGGHGLPVFRNINNLTKLSGSLGYQFFYYCEGDIVFSKTDIDKILEWRKKCGLYNKKLFIRSSIDNKSFVGDEDHATNVDLTFFGGEVEFWNKNIKLPNNNKEWVDLHWINYFENNQSIERLFYLKYKDLIKNQFIIETNLKDYFNNGSIINGYSFKDFVITPLYNIEYSSTPMLLIHNRIDKDYKVQIEVDGIQIFNQNTISNEFHILPVTFSTDMVIKMTCMDDDRIVKQEIYKINSLDELKNIGEISVYHE